VTFQPLARNLRYTALALLPALCLATTAHAQDEQDETTAATAGISAVLGKQLAILQQKPDAASEACVNALKELHTTQDQIAKEEQHSKDQDLGVARDVLESDFENATQYCGADARTLCRTDTTHAAKMEAACTKLSPDQ